MIPTHAAEQRDQVQRIRGCLCARRSTLQTVGRRTRPCSRQATLAVAAYDESQHRTRATLKCISEAGASGNQVSKRAFLFSTECGQLPVRVGYQHKSRKSKCLASNKLPSDHSCSASNRVPHRFLSTKDHSRSGTHSPDQASARSADDRQCL